MGWLVLSRRKHEELVFDLPNGEQMIVRVADIRGDKVRIGIKAPVAINIWRRELEERREAG